MARSPSFAGVPRYADLAAVQAAAIASCRPTRALHSSDVTLGSTYEMLQGYLQLSQRMNFPIARSIGLADSEYGYAWTGRAKLSSADETTTTPGCATHSHDGTASYYSYSGGRTGPRRARLISGASGSSTWYAARIACAAVPGTASAHYGISIDDGAAFATMLTYQTGGNVKVYAFIAISSDVSLASITTSLAAAAAGIWYRIIVDPAGSVTYQYSTTDTDDPASATWTTMVISAATNTGYRLANTHALTGGVYQSTGSSPSAYAITVRRALHSAAAPRTSPIADTIPPSWPATQYDTSGAAQLLGRVDFGGDYLPEQARLRIALSSAVNRRPGDTASVTLSVVGTASDVAPGAGTLYAAGSVLVGSTRYRYWWVYAVITSDGNTQGSIDMTTPISIEAAS